jgi:hypothetical protein
MTQSGFPGPDKNMLTAAGSALAGIRLGTLPSLITQSLFLFIFIRLLLHV